MTETEFEIKLTQVSDAKLLKMLEASRRDGPPIALKMILAEGKQRGLEEFQEPKPEKAMPGEANDRNSENGVLEKVEMENEVATGIDPVTEAALLEAASLAIGQEGKAVLDESPKEDISSGAPSPELPNWLDEENKESKVPIFVKALLFLGGLGALIFGAYQFIRRG
jgi:hypothetical protein